MSFLNKYCTTNLIINYSQEFQENGVFYSYAVGNTPEGPSILKCNSSGEIIWQKNYYSDSIDSSFSFHKIIQSTDNLNQIIYFLYATNGNDHYILSIKNNGAYRLNKQVPIFSPLGVELEPSKQTNNLFFAFSGLLAEGYGGLTLSQLILLEFDINLNIVNQKYFWTGSASSMILNSFKTNKNGLVVIFDHKGGNTHLIDFNYDLSVKIMYEIHLGENEFSNFYSQDVEIIVNNSINPINNKYVIVGKNNTNEVLLLTVQGTTGNFVYPISGSFNCDSKLTIYNNSLYMTLFEDPSQKSSSVIHKINPNHFSNLELLWSKSFQIENVSYGIKKLVNTVGSQNFSYHTINGDLLLLSDANLTTCKTIDLNYTFAEPTIYEPFLRSINIDSINYSVFFQNEFSIVNHTPNLLNICKPIPEPSLPCIKDKLICELYNSILKIFTNCLYDPKEKELLNDFSSQRECEMKIMEMLYEFDKTYPEYSLLSNFEIQIGLIKQFLENPTLETYTHSWESLQILLLFLSSTGNCNCENNFNLTDFSSIQSSHFYLQAAGSTGQDSTKGIHLRWALKGALSQHLPKANYASTDVHFNKKDDYVKIYRSKYNEHKIILDFTNAPISINHDLRYWVYNIGTKVFHVHFRDSVKYNYVKNLSTINPGTIEFIAAYGNSLLEIENKTELSFAISPKFDLANNSIIKTEILSVEENKISADKGASLRKTYTGDELNLTKLVSENIRSIRFVSENATIKQLEFEFYSDYIQKTKESNGWDYVGKYALTVEANTAFKRLEPQTNCLSNWSRFNDDAFVNAVNYKTKWNGIGQVKSISNLVTNYIQKSELDPLAIDTIPLYATGYVSNCKVSPTNLGQETYNPDNSHAIEISYLNMLQMGSLDYHVSRMLGLGVLDLNEVVFDGQYIYLSEYITTGDLKDGLGARKVQHLFCSLPTSLEDQRLPIPVNIDKIKAGIFYGSETGGQIELTDVNGLSHDGTTKYYSIYSDTITEEIVNANFYYQSHEFISSQCTQPVFAGLDYKKEDDLNWIKPELSNDRNFTYQDSDGNSINETKPILLPEIGKALYLHKVSENGYQYFNSYGINWFSRACYSDTITPIHTLDLKPVNSLLPPSNIYAVYIKKENPLLLSSASEQLMLSNNLNSDKTLVRLTFEYNHAQELKEYNKKVNGVEINNFQLINDDLEVFADDIEIFFRNEVPKIVSGKIEVNDSDPFTAIISTSPYGIESSGVVTPLPAPAVYNEYNTPNVPYDYMNNYEGSILLVNGKEFYIKSVDVSDEYPKFTIYKNDSDGNPVTINSVFNSNSVLISPDNNSLFVTVENMQNICSWAMPESNPIPLVTIDHTEIFQEEILIENIDCSNETHIQKFRGIYEDATIEKIFENVDENSDGEFDIIVPPNQFDPTNPQGYVKRHLGSYKIIFNSSFNLPHHSQYNPIIGQNSVDWFNGVVRIHTLDNPNGPRKVFNVFKIENVGSLNLPLILYFNDLEFPTKAADLLTYKGKLMHTNDSETTINQKVNYYPGYKVYLYKIDDLITEQTLFPKSIINANDVNEEDYANYSIFGLRSHDYSYQSIVGTDWNYYSNFSMPTLMFAQIDIEPKQPNPPSGGLFATRPDFYGKASYTFTTEFQHKPHSVQYNRASDIQILSAIYDNVTVQSNGLTTLQHVMKNILKNGDEPYYVDLWNDLLNFREFIQTTPPNSSIVLKNDYKSYPSNSTTQLPLPNSSKLINSINDFIKQHNSFYNLTGTNATTEISSITGLQQTVIAAFPNRNAELKIFDFVVDVIHNCFVPLTEIPVIYNFIKGQLSYFPNYKPIPKKQVVRDRNGNLLKPTDSDFDMAPMAVSYLINNHPATQFTDFGLDGASNAKYFYTVREINLQLKTGPYSTITGPISLVNSAPPTAPEVIKIIPVLENRTLGIAPCIQLQINAYNKIQNIKKINIYRANNANDSLSIRTMKLVKIIDLEVENLEDSSKWIFTDDFSELAQVPFGDPLYYRLTVSRQIKYKDIDDMLVVDYAPSEASKLVVTNIVENYSPESPTVLYTAFTFNSNTDNVISDITLYWEKTAYKANYHLYKMNAQGNWIEIIRVIADRTLNKKYHYYNLDANGNWSATTNPELINEPNGIIYVPLEKTNLANSSLEVLDLNGKSIYHHFKVITENTAGMFSKKENILTIYDVNTYQNNFGISSGLNPSEGMIIEGDFKIRNN